MKRLYVATGILLLTGCGHGIPQKHQVLYQCGTTPLTVSFNKEESSVSFVLDGEQLTLKQIQAVSGAKFSDGKYTFWSKGTNALVGRHDKVIMNDCTEVN